VIKQLRDSNVIPSDKWWRVTLPITRWRWPITKIMVRWRHGKTGYGAVSLSLRNLGSGYRHDDTGIVTIS